MDSCAPNAVTFCFRALVVCVYACTVCPVAFGQQYPFLAVPGSPRVVTSLYQDSKGRLWLGGDQAAFFDGVRFFPLRDYGLPAAPVHEIAEDNSGAIWIAAESGLYRFANGKLDEVGRAVVTSVVAVSADTAFASVGPLGKGVPLKVTLARIERAHGKWGIETLMPLDSPGPLTLDHNGRLLYARMSGGWDEISGGDLVRWHPGIRVVPSSHPLPGFAGFYAGAIRVVRDHAGCVWTSNSLDYMCDGKTWLPKPLNGDANSNLTESPDGQMVIVGNTLLAIGRPGSFRVARPPNGLPQLNTAIQGRDGTVWLGGAQGLFRFASPFRMEYWTARDGVDAPWSLERNAGDIYAGLDHRVGVLTRDRQRWQALASFPDIGQVVNLKTTREGNMLAALNPGGAALIRRDGTVLARTGGGPEFYGLRFTILPDNETWLGGLSLERLSRAGSLLNAQPHPLETPRPAGNVAGLQYENRTHRLWACYSGGLVVRYEDGT